MVKPHEWKYVAIKHGRRSFRQESVQPRSRSYFEFIHSTKNGLFQMALLVNGYQLLLHHVLTCHVCPYAILMHGYYAVTTHLRGPGVPALLTPCLGLLPFDVIIATQRRSAYKLLTMHQAGSFRCMSLFKEKTCLQVSGLV